MNHPNRKPNQTIALMVLGAIAVMAQAPAAFADDAAPTAKLDKIEITGSSIKRTIEDETALPVQIITRDDISRGGYQDTEQLLRSISATSGFAGTQVSTGSGATTSGVSTISLRGLGGSRTLVLINGKRSTVFGGAPGSGGNGAVDVNSIPLAAIERVEVLKDGASAIYGSDAIAGVVNFILRNNYNHGEVTANFGETLDGGGTQRKISGVVGFGDLLTDKYNVLISGNYAKEDPIYGAQRSFANSSYNNTKDPSTNNNNLSSNTFPANVVGPDSSRTNPGVPNNCAPSLHLPGQALCRFDTAPYVALIPDTERSNLLASGHLQINDDTQLYGDVAFGRNKTTYTIQPSPLSDLFAVGAGSPYINYLKGIEAQYPGLAATYGPGFASSAQKGYAFAGSSAILLLPGTPYYNTALGVLSPANQSAILAANSPIDIRYRSFAAGLRTIQDVTDNQRFVGGLKGLALGWDYDASLLYNRSKVTESTLGGYIQFSKFLPLVNSGVVNPFGPTDPIGSAEALAANYNGSVFDSTTTLTELDLKASRDIYQIPGGGPVAVALGGSLRQDKFDFQSSQQAQSGDLSGYGGNYLPVSKTRHVSAAFAEIEAQVTKSIELDAAVRYEDYQGTGSTVTPKLSGRWQAADSFLVRTSWGKGFRAPSLTDLYAPNTQGVSAVLSDPLTNCAGNTNSKNCKNQFLTNNGGNPNLQPEKSENFTLGLVWSPLKNVLANLDYYHINLSNSIAVGGLGASTVLGTAQNATTYANLITRDANNNILAINQLNANLFNIRTAGFDFGLNWNFWNQPSGAGKWTAGLEGTYVTKYLIQQPDGSYQNAVADEFVGYTQNGNAGVISRIKYIASLRWDFHDFNTTLIDNYQGSYIDASSTTAAGDPNKEHQVSSYNTVDLQTSYVGFKNWVIAAGARNLFNTAPPYSNIGGGALFQAGYDSTYGDPRGRFTYASVTYKFK